MPKKLSVAQKSKAKKGGKKKRAVDVFLKKDWYVVKVPKYMPTSQNKWRVGYTPATKGKARKALESRSFVINLGDLQNEGQKNEHDDLNWKKFKFITEEVFGDKLLTQWHGMEITRDKRCSLIRKWHSMITAFCDAKTTDGYVLRVKALAFTKRQMGQIKKNCYANLASLINYKKTSKVYICGPTGFIADTIKFLDEINIPVENVFYEHFGPLM